MRIRGYASGTPCWADVAGPDLADAQRFYGELFGWTLAESEPTRWELRGQPVAGFSRGGPPAWSMYVSVDDVVVATRAVTAAGGHVVREPVDVSTAGRSAMCTDPSGARFTLWQRGGFGGARLFNEPGAVCWYELASPDPGTAAAFYGDVFGWQARPDDATPDGFEWINGEDSVAGLVPGNAGWQVHLMVDDCLGTAERVAELGGRTLGPPTDTAMCRQARLADPGGATFVVAELAAEVRRALHS
jgi:predicted enzyme related to lactoylglutathione lyase